MAFLRKNGSTSNILRFTLKNSSSGAALTGLSSSSSGLVISTICDVESSATAYTAAGSTIQTIATLGTFAAPTSGDCRFKEVDSTNHPGLYEFQFADARFAVSGAKQLVISLSGAANLLDAHYEVELTACDVQDGVHLGISSLPNTACTTNASLITSGSGTDQLHVSSGKVAEVTLVDTLTTYTGNTPQTGDVFGQLPTHFSALGIGSTGKIIEVALVDTLTTYTGNTPQTGDVFGQLPAHFAALGISAAGKINEVVLCDTITTYTGNTPQTGDSYARLGAAGAGLTALGDARLAHLDADVSSRATGSAAAAAVWSTVVDATYTAIEYIEAIGAATAGANATDGAFKNLDATKTVISGTDSTSAPFRTSITYVFTH